MKNCKLFDNYFVHKRTVLKALQIPCHSQQKKSNIYCSKSVFSHLCCFIQLSFCSGIMWMQQSSGCSFLALSSLRGYSVVQIQCKRKNTSEVLTCIYKCTITKFYRIMDKYRKLKLISISKKRKRDKEKKLRFYKYMLFH